MKYPISRLVLGLYFKTVSFHSYLIIRKTNLYLNSMTIYAMC
jgi:hypothetical protein